MSAQSNKKSYKTTASLRRTPYYFVTPYILIYLVFNMFPILFGFYIGLTDWDGVKPVRTFVGLKNYIYLFTQDQYFLTALKNTALFVIIYIPVTMLLGLLLASALQSQLLKLKRPLQVATFMPYVTTPIAVGLIFGFMFDQKYGAVNSVLRALGLSEKGVDWLGLPGHLQIVIIILLIWKWTGYQMIFFSAGLANIPQEIYESAWVDGAKFRHTFFKITIPMLFPIFTFLIITNIINGFQLLEEPMMLVFGWSTGGNIPIGGAGRGGLTVMWHMYDTAFTHFFYGRGAAISYALFMIILLVTIVLNIVLKKVGDRYG